MLLEGGAVESSRLAKGIHIRPFAVSHQHDDDDAIDNARLLLGVHGKTAAEGEEAFLIKESQQYLEYGKCSMLK